MRNKGGKALMVDWVMCLTYKRNPPNAPGSLDMLLWSLIAAVILNETIIKIFACFKVVDAPLMT